MQVSTKNPNDSFFHSSYKHAWKQLIPPGLTEAEVDFIMEVGHLQPGSKVLDLMCGYGRHALELAKRGVEVTAIDNLPEYITEIHERAGAEGLPVKAICEHALSMDLQDQFDMVICMGNSFAFFNEEDALRLLQKIESHLNPAGKLMINSWMIAEIAIKYFREHDWHYAGDYKCVLDYQYRYSPSRIESEQTIIAPDGSVEVLRGVDYIFTLNEMEKMCAACGLHITDLYSSPRKKQFVLGDGKVYLLAGKIS